MYFGCGYEALCTLWIFCHALAIKRGTEMNKILLLVMVLTLSFFSVATGQPWQGRGRWGAWSNNYYQWKWDPESIETVEGMVASKDVLIPVKDRRQFPAAAMTLKTDQGHIFLVHLGPQWYFDMQELGIKIGHIVEVTGSRIQVDRYNVLLTSSIKKEDKTWQFRDPEGLPYWSGRRW